MKKLLVLLLVLAVSSAASAAVIGLRIANPQQEYQYSDVITIEVYSQGFTDLPYYVIGFVDQMTIGNSTMNHGGTITGLTLHPVLASGPEAVVSVGEVQDESTGLAISGIKGAPDGMQYVDEATDDVLYHFEIHIPDVPASTIIEISIDDVGVSDPFSNNLDGYDVGPALSVHVIPEPMTIALLGLGGLLLRRKK